MQSKYEVLGIVGEGAYGKVFKCKNKENTEFVAMKQFKEVEDDLVKKTMARELKVLQMLKHDNIVEFKEAFKRKGNLYLVFEYVEKNLLELLQESPKGLDPSVIKKLIFQICLAIKYLHDMNIVHRDIKPENLLVHDNLKLKLCDFGFARMIKSSREKLTDYVATRWYRSPELLLSAGFYGPEVDYWAIGCIMGELADGDPLFDGTSEIDQIIVIQRVLGKLPDYQIELFYNNPHFKGVKLPEVPKPETLERRYMGKLSKQAISFMKALLNPDPKLRLKGEAIFTHPYFENYTNPFPPKMPSNVDHNENKAERRNNAVSGLPNNNSMLNDNISNNANANANNNINQNHTSSLVNNINVNNNNNTNNNSGNVLQNLITQNIFNSTIKNFNVTNTNNQINPIGNNNAQDKKLKTNNNIQPIISNLTNINIINYNNFDPSGIKNSNTEKFLSQQQSVNSNYNSLNFDSDKLGNKIFYNNNSQNSGNNLNSINTNLPGEKKQNKLINSNKFLQNKNMVLTSYNFNQNLKDNILSLYTSTTFDKNFKTFYKGDPYNFDIDINFLNNNQKILDKKSDNNSANLNSILSNINLLEDEKLRKNTFLSNNNAKKMNHTTSSDKLNHNNYNNPVFNSSQNQNNLNIKKKAGVSLHDKIKPSHNTIYEENYQINSKVIPIKFPGFKLNPTMLKNLYTKDIHLPSINSKNFVVKKNAK